MSKKFDFWKKCPQSSKIPWRGGGVGLVLEEVHKKAAFFWGNIPKYGGALNISEESF